MSRKEFRSLITLEDAINELRPFSKPRIKEEEISNINGSVLAEDIYSEVDVPSFDRAAMDGFAVRAEDTFGAEEDDPIKLKITGELEPGIVPSVSIEKSEACEIATGAVMPSGSNSVVMIENVVVEGDNALIRKGVTPEENVMHAGSDIMAGERVLSEGTQLTAKEIGVLASIGKKRTKVYDVPKIGIISLGDELLPPGRSKKVGKIYDVNSYSLSAGIKEAGGKPIKYGIVSDSEEEIRSKLSKALSECDLVITSGSTSAGATDMLYDIAGEGDLLFHGIKIKPGKPTLASNMDGTLLVGLPGYPTSALTIFKLLVDPLIRIKRGVKEKKPKYVSAILSTKVNSIQGRKQFLPVGLIPAKRHKKDEENKYDTGDDNTKFVAYPVYKGSGAITSLSNAEGFLHIRKNEKIVSEGDKRKVTLFSDELKLPELLIIGSHCVGIDILTSMISRNSKSINTGSRGGMQMMSKGIPDISGMHLLSKDNIYNVSHIKDFGLGNIALYKGYVREQGIIVKKGNPLNIKGIKDLSEAKIINRNRGSGTRRLLDLEFKRVADEKDIDFNEFIRDIEGYKTTCRTHSAVASSVKMDKVDAGIAIKPFAKSDELDFIPLCKEEFDFMISLDRIRKKSVKEFIKKLKSKSFEKKLSDVRGLSTYRKTGKRVI